MRIFETYRELNAAMNLKVDEPGAFRLLPRYGVAGFVCAHCGAVRLFNMSGNGGTGYAQVDGGQLICYPCSYIRARESLLDRTKPFYAYMQSGTNSITTWIGGVLGTAHDMTQSRFGRHSEVCRFRMLDVHGQWWQGRGAGRGMCCTLRPMQPPEGRITAARGVR